MSFVARIQALQRFYEMGESEGELDIAYAKLFTTATDWLSPLADWAIRDARAVGGLPRIYLSSQPVTPTHYVIYIMVVALLLCRFVVFFVLLSHATLPPQHSSACGGSSTGVGVCPRAAARTLPRPFDLREVGAQSARGLDADGVRDADAAADCALRRAQGQSRRG